MLRHSILLLALLSPGLAHAQPAAFFDKHCVSCHDAEKKRGGFDLTALPGDLADPENFARWVTVHDRIAGGGFKHGQHLAFDTKNNYPLTNLYVSMLQRLGIEVNEFSSGRGTLRGLEMA